MLRTMRTTAAVVAVTGMSLFAMTAAGAHPGGHSGPRPTIVLVHGAFADSSGFNAVTQRLLADG